MDGCHDVPRDKVPDGYAKLFTNYECAICKGLACRAVETNCGHLFGEGCIHRLVSMPSNARTFYCPICRTLLPSVEGAGWIKAKTVQKGVSELIDALPPGTCEERPRLADLVSAARDDPRAMHSLALHHIRESCEGLTVPVNETELRRAAVLLESASARGHVPSMLRLSRLLTCGHPGVPKNHERAAELLRDAAGRGDPDGQAALGLFYINGPRSDGAIENATRLFDLALRARPNHAEANFGKAWLASFDESQSELAAALYRKAAEAGSVLAMNAYGAALFTGRGVAKDQSEAVRWHKKAAGQGSVDAMFRCGFALAHGFGCNRDLVNAVKYYRDAANRGHSAAQFNLGAMVSSGEGTPRDDKEAWGLFSRSAATGFPPALNAMAIFRMHGRAVDRDLGEADRLFKAAAEKGYTVSEAHLRFLASAQADAARAVQGAKRPAPVGQSPCPKRQCRRD